MRLEIRSTAPPKGRHLCVAFLHEARDPAAEAPEAVRKELEEACRVSAFGGREKEVAGVLTKRGGWVLIGLGPSGSPLGKVRRALRRAGRLSVTHQKSYFVLALTSSRKLSVRTICRVAVGLPVWMAMNREPSRNIPLEGTTPGGAEKSARGWPALKPLAQSTATAIIVDVRLSVTGGKPCNAFVRSLFSRLRSAS